jgi:hypothetical protein
LTGIAQGGDAVDFVQLVEAHRTELHAHCHSMLGSLHDAGPSVCCPPGLRPADASWGKRGCLIWAQNVGRVAGRAELDHHPKEQ